MKKRKKKGNEKERKNPRKEGKINVGEQGLYKQSF